MRYDDQKPALVTILNVLGWLAIFGAFGMALIRTGHYTAPFPALAWTGIISTAVGGFLFLTFACIIRGLHRIEQAIRETQLAPPLPTMSAKLRATSQAKKSDLDSLR
jgi:hypothetical protein